MSSSDSDQTQTTSGKTNSSPKRRSGSKKRPATAGEDPSARIPADDPPVQKAAPVVEPSDTAQSHRRKTAVGLALYAVSSLRAAAGWASAAASPLVAAAVPVANSILTALVANVRSGSALLREVARSGLVRGRGLTHRVAAFASAKPKEFAIVAGVSAGGFAVVALLGTMVWRENQQTAMVTAPPITAAPRTVSMDREAPLATGERARLSGDRLTVKLIERAGDGSRVLVSVWDNEPIALQRGVGLRVPNGSMLCDLTYTGDVGDRAVIQGDCRPGLQPDGLDVGLSVEQVVHSGSVATFGGGALRLDVSIVSPGGGTIRARLNEGPLETLEVGVPVTVYTGSDVCGVTLTDVRAGVGRLAAACSGEAGRMIGIEADLAAVLDPYRRTSLQAGETASFAGDTIDVYLASVTARRDAARLSIDGGVVTAVPLGGVQTLETETGPCVFAITAIRDNGIDLSAACFGRLAGPATIARAGEVTDSARGLVQPGSRVSMLGDRVRILLSMVSPDGEAVRWSLNDAGLRTTVLGDAAEIRVGAGTCRVLPLRVEEGRLRVKATCDPAALEARPQVTAAEDTAEIRPNQVARLLGGKLKVGLSMISPDGEAIRLAVNDAELQTIERGAPLSIDYGDGLCSIEYVAKGTAGARIRAACDSAALASDVIVPEKSERVTMAVNEERRLLDGRLSLRLSMISPDGEAIRFSANGGDLMTALQARPFRFASGQGTCELVYREREGDRAVLNAGCDAAATASAPFVPERTERVEIGTGARASLQSGRLELAVNMVAPDRRAVRLSVNGGRLQTVERGRPSMVPVGTGHCQIAFLSYTNGEALLETVCDAGAFQQAPVPESHFEQVALHYRTPVSLFDGRHRLELSMIAPRRDAVRLAVDGRLATLDLASPLPLPVADRDCALVLTEIASDDRVTLKVGCGAGLRDVIAVGPIPPERTLVATGETARLLKGALSLKLEMISPSRTGLRVSIDGAKVSSLDRGVPRVVDIAGRSCRLDFLGVDRSGAKEQAIVEGSCE